MDSVLVIKVISALAYPLGLVGVLWLLNGVFALVSARKMAWFCRGLALVILLLASNPMVAAYLASSLEDQYPQIPMDDIAEHDAIVVLGGGIRIPLPPAQHVQLGSAADRFWYATQLYRAKKAKRIVLLGGNVFEQPGFRGEAYYAAQLLQDWGVPKSAIMFESNSRTTAQNNQNFRQLLAEQNIQSILLVTSALHMPRSIELFRQLPVPVTPASADVLVRDHSAPAVFSWLPSARALSLSTVALHEYYGCWYSRLKGV